MKPGGNITLDQMVFRNLYFRYRDFVTPVVTMLVCLLLFWFVVVPQMQGWFQLRDSIAVDTQKLSVMHQNLSLLTSLNDATLNQMLTTATTALPAEKDFAGIVSSIQNAAAISGSSLGDYSFQLGDLSGLDQNGRPSQLPLQLNVVLKGDIADAERFATQLRKQLPLSDAIAIAVNSNESITVTTVFYYAALPKIVFEDGSPLPVLGSADQQLLVNLANGNNFQNANLGTASANLSPTPKLSPTLTPTFTPTPTASATATPTPVASGSAR